MHKALLITRTSGLSIKIRAAVILFRREGMYGSNSDVLSIRGSSFGEWRIRFEFEVSSKSPLLLDILFVLDLAS